MLSKICEYFIENNGVSRIQTWCVIGKLKVDVIVLCIEMIYSCYRGS